MIKIIIILYLVSVYISLPGLFSKAGYKAILGLIPIVNIYILVQILEINPILQIILSLGLIFLDDRAYIVTLIFLFLPFVIADAYDKNFIYGLLCNIIPFILYPYLAYFNGTYRYNLEED